MKITIKYFGPVRERVGCEEEELVLSDIMNGLTDEDTDNDDRASGENVTVEDLAEFLLEHYPALDGLLGSCRVAVDMEYVTGNHLLRDGSEVALIPPVAGG